MICLGLPWCARWNINAAQKIKNLSETPVTVHNIAKLCVIDGTNKLQNLLPSASRMQNRLVACAHWVQCGNSPPLPEWRSQGSKVQRHLDPATIDVCAGSKVCLTVCVSIVLRLCQTRVIKLPFHN